MNKRTALLLLLCSQLAWAQAGQPVEDRSPTVGVLSSKKGPVEVQDVVIDGPSSTVQGESPLRPPNPNEAADLNPFPTRFLPWSLGVSGQPLSLGASLRTAAQGGATVILSNGTELVLDENTELTLTPGSQAVRLLRGRVWLRTQRPLNLHTPEGIVEVKGTELVLSAGPTEAVLTVVEGQARVAGTEVASGQAVHFADDVVAAAPVQVEVPTRTAWVRERTAPEQLPLRPYFATSAEREQARAAALTRSEDPAAQEGLIKVYLDERRLQEAEDRLATVPAPALRARLALLKGDFASARGAADPLERAVALWGLGEAAAARQSLAQALQQDPNNAQALALSGYLGDYQQGYFTRAAAQLERASALAPQDAAIWRELGDAYAALGRSGAALDAYERARSLGLADDPDTALREGVLLTRLGRYDQALPLFTLYREKTPSVEADLHQALASGYAALNEGRYEEAYKEGERAQQLAGANSPTLRHLALDLTGLALASARRYPEAVVRYREALALKPGDPYLQNDLGVALRKSGELGEALENLRAARDGAPASPAVRNNLGRLYFVLQQLQHAQSEFEQGLAFAPQDPALLIGLSDSLLFQGLDDSSSRLLRQSTLLDPLLLAARPRLFAVNSQTSPDAGPIYLAAAQGRQGPVAWNLQGRALLNERPTPEVGAGDNLSGQAQVGAIITPEDRVAIRLLGLRNTDPRGVGNDGQFGSLGENELGYLHDFGAHTRLWGLYLNRSVFFQSHLDQPYLARTEARDSLSRVSNNNFELRLDQDLGPDNLLSVGYAHSQGTSTLDVATFAPSFNSSASGQSILREIWLSDAWQLNDTTKLTFGGVWKSSNPSNLRLGFAASGRVLSNTATGEATSVFNPFLGLTSQLTPETRLSLSVVRQSSLNDLTAGAITDGQVARLIPVMTSSTTLFPLSYADRQALRVNSLDARGTILPYWDYRLRLNHEFGSQVFGVFELFRTDLSPSQGRDLQLVGINTPSLLNLLAGERHRLQGLNLNCEFWDGGDTTGIFRYAFRDYQFESGPDAGNYWARVPQHTVELDLFRALAPQVLLELHPFYASGTFSNAANTQSLPGFFQFDALLHWTPLPDSRISVGYQNILNNPNSFQRPGWLTNLLISF